MNSPSSTCSTWSSTTSITPSFEATVEYGGRSYLDSPQFVYSDVLPNDARERRRLQTEHELVQKLLSSNPISRPVRSRVLDLDAGCGEWATKTAEEDAESAQQVIGLIKSTALLTTTTVPTNCDFLVHDIQSDRSLSNKKVDLVRACLLNGIRDWGALLKRVSDCLAPEGEMMITHYQFPPIRTDGQTASTSALLRWSEIVMNRAGAMNINLELGNDIETAARSAGLVCDRLDVRRTPVIANLRVSDAVYGYTDFEGYWEETIKAFARMGEHMLEEDLQEGDDIARAAIQELRDSEAQVHFEVYRWVISRAAELTEEEASRMSYRGLQ